MAIGKLIILQQTRSTEVMEYLIKNGCHVNATNALGETPLHIAAATHFDGEGVLQPYTVRWR